MSLLAPDAGPEKQTNPGMGQKGRQMPPLPDFSKGLTLEILHMVDNISKEHIASMGLSTEAVDYALPGGTTLTTTILSNGVLYPTMCTDKRMRLIQEMEVRDDDIFLITYPKTGTHWFYNVIRSLLELQLSKNIMLLDADTPMMPQQLIDSMKSPRFFVLHIDAHWVPHKLVASKAKVIYTVRNPKDTTLSLYHHMVKMPPPLNFRGSWDDMVEWMLSTEHKQLYGGQLEHMRAWTQLFKDQPGRFLPLSFEDMKLNTLATLGRLASFLGCCADEDKLKRVAMETDFSAFKEQLLQSKNSVAHMIYRKGDVGDWKNTFTVAQNENMDQMLQQWDAPLNYTFIYTK